MILRGDDKIYDSFRGLCLNAWSRIYKCESTSSQNWVMPRHLIAKENIEISNAKSPQH